jgi:hypothetical protein
VLTSTTVIIIQRITSKLNLLKGKLKDGADDGADDDQHVHVPQLHIGNDLQDICKFQYHLCERLF